VKQTPVNATAKSKCEEYQTKVWIDDSFRVEKSRWGTWSSYDKEGNQLVASLTEEICVDATRFYLKGKQDGFPEAGVSYDSTVGGKL
jgi:hypothetical protein